MSSCCSHWDGEQDFGPKGQEKSKIIVICVVFQLFPGVGAGFVGSPHPGCHCSVLGELGEGDSMDQKEEEEKIKLIKN